MRLVQLVVFGLVTGSFLLLATIGFALIRHVEGFLNIAHAQYMAIAAFTAWYLNVELGWPFLTAALAAVVASGLLGWFVARVFYDPVKQRGPLVLLITSVGMVFVLQGIIDALFGGGTFAYEIPRAETIRLAGIRITNYQIGVIVLAVVTSLGLATFLTRTRTGLAIRAMAIDRNLAASRGVDITAASRATWLVASALAGIAGVVLAVLGTLTPEVASDDRVRDRHHRSRPQAHGPGEGGGTLNWLQLGITVITLGCILGVVVMALNLQYGHGGMVNLGLVAYFAAGAYAYAIATQPPPSGVDQYVLGLDWPPWAGFILAGAAALLFGLITGPPSLRLRGEYLAITTFAFAEVFRSLLINERRIGNGTLGLAGIERPYQEAITFTEYDYVFAAAAALFAIVTFVVLHRIVASPYGRLMEAIRDDDVAVVTSGKTVRRGWVLGVLPAPRLFRLGGGV